MLAGNKMMNVGERLANTVLYDYTGNVKEDVYVDCDGNGIFLLQWRKCFCMDKKR